MRALFFENTMAMVKELMAYNAARQEKIVLSLEFDNSLEEMWPLMPTLLARNYRFAFHRNPVNRKISFSNIRLRLEIVVKT